MFTEMLPGVLQAIADWEESISV